MAFTASVFDVQFENGSMEEQPASFHVVFLGKALHKIHLYGQRSGEAKKRALIDGSV